MSKTYIKPLSGIPCNIVYFYDIQIGLWTVYGTDQAGNQITDADYAPNRNILKMMLPNIINDINDAYMS